MLYLCAHTVSTSAQHASLPEPSLATAPKFPEPSGAFPGNCAGTAPELAGTFLATAPGLPGTFPNFPWQLRRNFPNLPELSWQLDRNFPNVPWQLRRNFPELCGTFPHFISSQSVSDMWVCPHMAVPPQPSQNCNCFIGNPHVFRDSHYTIHGQSQMSHQQQL